MYTVFTRTWWKENPSWPNGLEPGSKVRKAILETGLIERQAVQMCKKWHEENAPGRLSRKAEFIYG